MGSKKERCAVRGTVTRPPLTPGGRIARINAKVNP